MKRILKRAIRPFWKLTAPLRRPFTRKLDAKLQQMVAIAVQTQVLPAIEASLNASNQTLHRLEHSLGAANHSAFAMATDMDLMLGSVVRELARMQAQFDTIHELIESSASGRGGLSLVDSGDDGEPVTRPAGVERSKVG